MALSGSRGEVPIDASVVELLRGFRARATGAFVIEGGDDVSGPRMWGRNYRVQNVFDKVTAWLRGHGVTARKPLHELRRELGALITSEHGIYAASRVLRHADLATTAAHYTDLKTLKFEKRSQFFVGGNDESLSVFGNRQRQ